MTVRLSVIALALLPACYTNTPAPDASSGQCPSVTVTPLAPFPVPLRDSVASPPLGGRIYLVGGSPSYPPKPPPGPDGPDAPDGGVWTWDFYPYVWSFDPGRGLAEKTPIVLPYALAAVRRNGIAVGKNGKVYIPPSDGPTFDDGYGFHKCIIEIDPVGGKAMERACFPGVRWALRLAADRAGLIWFFAGWTAQKQPPGQVDHSGKAIDEIWSYDPATDQLTKSAATCGGPDQGMAGDIIQDSLLGPDGLIYHFTYKDVASFDPATQRFTMLGPHGMTGVERVWVGKDGLIHGFGSAYRSYFTLKPGTSKATSTPIPQVTTKEGAATSVDTAAGRLYLIGGAVNSVERIDCLP